MSAVGLVCQGGLHWTHWAEALAEAVAGVGRADADGCGDEGGDGVGG